MATLTIRVSYLNQLIGISMPFRLFQVFCCFLLALKKILSVMGNNSYNIKIGFCFIFIKQKRKQALAFITYHI